MCILTGIIIAGLQIQEPGITGENKEEGEQPGYFSQWLGEKQAADGSIPKWMQAKWANADKFNLLRRASNNLFDTAIELGPNNIGGRTRAIWVDPRNENIILAGSVSGGLWRSTDGGANWKPVNDQETSLAVTSITSSPFNPDIIYYSTGESRGNSADVGGNGIYKSTDGGKTFSVLPSTVGKTGFDVIWKIAHSQNDSNTIFVGTDAYGMFRSTDGGSTWTQAYKGGNNQVTEIITFPNNRVIITMQASLIVASDSGGKSGTFKGVSFPQAPGSGQFRRIQMSNCKKYPKVVYALFEGYAADYTDTPARFYKSSDYGVTWTRRSSPTSISSGQQGYCTMIGCSPADSNYVVTGAMYIAQTSNGGKSWSKRTTGHSDHHGYAYLPTSTTDYLVGTDGGIYRYKWSGGAPVNLNKGYNCTQFYAGGFGIDGMVSISGAQDNGTQVATGHITSKQFYGGDGAYAHIGQQDGTVSYFSTQNDGIRRNTDFNSTTIPAFTDDISDAAFATDGVDFINAYTLNYADQYQLYYRTNKRVYRTLNGGDVWTSITNIKSSIKALACSAESDPVLYFGGASTQLYKIENAASSAAGKEVNYNNEVPAPIANDMMKSIVVHPKDKYTIYFALNNYSTQSRVWRCSGLDSAHPKFVSVGGNLPSGLPVNSIAIDPTNPDKNLVAGTDFGLYYSTDSGKTWMKETRIPNVPVFEVKIRNDRTVFVYTHGRGMWFLRLTGGSMGTKSFSQNTGIKVFPNPAIDFVQLQIPVQSHCTAWSIFDMQGQLIQSSKGDYNGQPIDVRQLSSGYYFIRARDSQNNTYTSRLLIQK